MRDFIICCKGLELGHFLSAITTDDAKDVVEVVEELCHQLSDCDPERYSNERFHLRCIAHVIYPADCACMTLIHGRVEKIRHLLNSVRASVKRRDIPSLDF